MIEINNIDDQRISSFKSLKDKFNKQNELIIAESEKVVLKLLSSNIVVEKILATESFYEQNNPQIDYKKTECYVATKELLKLIVGHKLHHGVMAIAKRPKNINIIDLNGPILIMNGITSPENVGTIVRNATAFGVQSIIVDLKTCSPHARRCIRVSMGNIFSAKIHYTEDLYKCIESLKKSNYKIFGTANKEDSIDIQKISFPLNTAVIIGSEGHGIDKEILKVCDYTVRIPIDSRVAAINAACSSSIFLYQISQNFYKNGKFEEI